MYNKGVFGLVWTTMMDAYGKCVCRYSLANDS